MKKIIFYSIFSAYAILTCVLNAKIVEQIYVVVNDDVITMTEFQQEKKFYLKQNAQMKNKIKNLNYLIITNMIDSALIRQDAINEGIEVTENDVKIRFNQLMKMNNIPNIEQFKIVLKQQGISYDDLYKRNEDMQYRETLMYRVITVSEPTYDEVKSFYNKNKKEFKIDKPLVKASHILLKKVSGMSFGDIMKKESECKNILKEINDGLDFTEAVKKYSEDELTKNADGSLGFINPADMPPEFSAALAKLKENQISKVVSTKSGFHIIRLDERMSKGYMPLTTASHRIKNMLFRQKQEKEFIKYVKNLWRRSTIIFKVKISAL